MTTETLRRLQHTGSGKLHSHAISDARQTYSTLLAPELERGLLRAKYLALRTRARRNKNMHKSSTRKL